MRAIETAPVIIYATEFVGGRVELRTYPETRLGPSSHARFLGFSHFGSVAKQVYVTLQCCQDT